MSTAGLYLRLAMWTFVVVVALPIGQLWKWGADNCESSCDRWSYSDVAVFAATWGPWVVVLLLACEAAYAHHRAARRRR